MNASVLQTGHGASSTGPSASPAAIFRQYPAGAGELDERPRPCILAGLRLQQALDARRAFNSWFAVSLLVPDVARNTIRLDLAMRRFAHQPTYVFPWHGGVIPVPYQ